ncbi:hypothetical protein MTR67_042630 [Solanum verrucosum]|uniref:Alcohol dehydrogenase n=1 Tax=Solanum verrucosum TaxID=315347 RepID=A0AAF0UNU1_SOLVR|nr:hypothetical protein MTR67_042630 [Solanum verrucosum]
MIYASLCATNVLCCNGFPKPLFPRIPGHEGVGLPIEHVPFLCCAFTTGFGATWKDVNIEKGSTVAVLGLGGVGLGVSDYLSTMEAKD